MPLASHASVSAYSALAVRRLLAASTACRSSRSLCAFQRPSNVAAYVAVTDGSEPVTELQPESFKIYENEQLLAERRHASNATAEGARRVSPHGYLLVDMSGEQGSDDALGLRGRQLVRGDGAAHAGRERVRVRR